MAPVPRLETTRLVLRAHEPGDLAASLRLWSEPAVVRFTTRRPQTEEEIWLRLLRYRGSWAMLGFGFWLVEDRASGEAIGEAGLQDLRRNSDPSFAGTPEIGWALRPEWHGRGLAREAVEAVLGFADSHPAAERLACIIDPDNAASIRLAARAGFSPAGRAMLSSGPVLLLYRVRPPVG